MLARRLMPCVCVVLFAAACGGSAPTPAPSPTVPPPVPAPAPAPAPTYTLAGVVTDASTGRPINGGTARVLDGANANKSSATDGNGYYSIPGVAVSSFTLQATASGYQAADKGLTVAADTRLDLALQPNASTPAPTPTPPPSPTPPPGPSPGNTCPASSVPAGVTAVCSDGAFSRSQHRPGTCSTHGGVRCWICPGPLCAP